MPPQKSELWTNLYPLLFLAAIVFGLALCATLSSYYQITVTCLEGHSAADCAQFLPHLPP